MRYKLIAVLLIVFLVLVYIEGMKVLEKPLSFEHSPIEFGAYRQPCDALCSRYIDSNFDIEKAAAQCEKYFEIDSNKNGKIMGDVNTIYGGGVCEERIYCFNIKECIWGSSKRSRLTPEKCKKLMCEFYTNQTGDYRQAESIIQEKMQFGSCDPYDPEILYEDENGNVMSLASWWIDNFQNVDCSNDKLEGPTDEYPE